MPHLGMLIRAVCGWQCCKESLTPLWPGVRFLYSPRDTNTKSYSCSEPTRA